MTAANQQIVTSFEELGLSPNEISEELDIDLTAVKAILMQFSTSYRKALGKDEALNFTSEQEQAVLDVISNIAKGYTDCDTKTQLKAAMFLRNDRRGRLDIGKQLQGLNINVFAFNDQMRKAIEAKKRSKDQVIDVEEISMGK